MKWRVGLSHNPVLLNAIPSIDVERLRDLIDTELFLLDRIVDFLLPSQTAVPSADKDFRAMLQQLLRILPMGELPPIPVRVAAAIGDG